MLAVCRAKFKWSILSAAIYDINKLYMPRVLAYNEIHEGIGGEVYIALLPVMIFTAYSVQHI